MVVASDPHVGRAGASILPRLIFTVRPQPPRYPVRSVEQPADLNRGDRNSELAPPDNLDQIPTRVVPTGRGRLFLQAGCRRLELVRNWPETAPQPGMRWYCTRQCRPMAIPGYYGRENVACTMCISEYGRLSTPKLIDAITNASVPTRTALVRAH